MEKICKTASTLYRVPRIGHLNLRLTNPTLSNAGLAQNRTDSTLAGSIKPWNLTLTRNYSLNKPTVNLNLTATRLSSGKSAQTPAGQQESIEDILEREIQDESAELSQHLSTDQFPGFSVETDDADVKLTKQVRDATVVVRCTVSSSLNEWPSDNGDQSEGKPEGETNASLVSMPEFQVQITRNGKTLELSCYFEEMDQDEETGETYSGAPVFCVDELVVYEGEPKETEFAVSAEYFQEDLQEALLHYLAEYGIDDEFAKNLVNFATNYEKKQYISLMKRLKNFVST